MKSVRLVRVFASFPSDVNDEAGRLDSIVNELNRTAADAYGVRYEVLTWLRDVRPGSANDVQDVVNRQMKGNFDVIVATFWTRAGTPTPRADSGSIEEVKTAVLASKSDGRFPIVLVYMKSAGADPATMDPAQLQTLKDFRAWLSEYGVLYKSFQDHSSFESLLRIDLSKVAAELSRIDLTHPVTEIAGSMQESDDELGLLDYLDLQEEAFSRLGELLEDQTTSLDRLSASNREGTAEADQLLLDGPDRSAIRRVLRKSSQSWTLFAVESGSRLNELQNVTDQAFDAMSRALSLGASGSEEERTR